MSIFTKVEAKAFHPSLYIIASMEEEGTGKFCQFYCSFRMLCCCNWGAFPHRNFASSGENCGALLRNWEFDLCWNTQDLQWGIHVGGEGGRKRWFSKPSESRSLGDCMGCPFSHFRQIKAVHHNDTPVPDMEIQLLNAKGWQDWVLLNLTTDAQGIATFSLNTTQFNGEDIRLKVGDWMWPITRHRAPVSSHKGPLGVGFMLSCWSERQKWNQ